MEQVYQSEKQKKQVRPFQSAAQVRSRSLSLGLQRAIVDFGADTSFSSAAEKVREHYGIEVSVSSVRDVTQKHGFAMELETEIPAEMPNTGVKTLVAQIDGTFLPVVETGDFAGDKRKQRECKYMEARLSLAASLGDHKPKYAATFGSVESAGLQWKSCAIRAGCGKNTQIHCVADGARWIESQVKEQFGKCATFLVDFYHLSEYLSAASKAISKDDGKVWLWQQQDRMKQNKAEEVLAELSLYQESKDVSDLDAPVRKCLRYIESRLDYLDYKGTLEKGLPIGSGEIESGHKSVLQSRLKLSGAWWKQENAEKMMALRITRANGDWQSYWKGLRQAHA